MSDEGYPLVTGCHCFACHRDFTPEQDPGAFNDDFRCSECSAWHNQTSTCERCRYQTDVPCGFKACGPEAVPCARMRDGHMHGSGVGTSKTNPFRDSSGALLPGVGPVLQSGGPSIMDAKHDIEVQPSETAGSSAVEKRADPVPAVIGGQRIVPKPSGHEITFSRMSFRGPDGKEVPISGVKSIRYQADVEAGQKFACEPVVIGHTVGSYSTQVQVRFYKRGWFELQAIFSRQLRRARGDRHRVSDWAWWTAHGARRLKKRYGHDWQRYVAILSEDEEATP